MAQKRKAKEAFGQPQGQLSAVAAARLARQQRIQEPVAKAKTLVTETAALSYDGHHGGGSTPLPDVHDDEQSDLLPAESSLPTIPALADRQDNIIADETSHLELRLKPGESVLFIGEYEIEVLDSSGVIAVLGTLLRAKDGALRIYAPSTHPLPPVRAMNVQSTIRISSIDSGIRKLEALSPKFRNIWSTTTAVHERSFTYLGTCTDTQELPPPFDILKIEKRTEEVLRALSSKSLNSQPTSKPRIMAIGAKSSGKSTFNRLLCNYTSIFSPEKKFLYLDLDPGQPEFSPAGQISLIEVSGPISGPPFTHFALPDERPLRLMRAHAITATSFKDDPEHYKACVLDLIRHVDKTIPVIINSCGWVSGLGAEVLLDLIPALSITDIVFLEPLDDSFMQRILQNPANEALTLHRIPRHPSKPLSRTPAESRAMQTMAYFHHRSPPPSAGSDGNTSKQPKWSGKPLSRCRPWVVKYTTPNFAIMSYGQHPDPEFLAEVLDGSIVAVVVVDEDAAVDTSSLFLSPTPASPSPTCSSLTSILDYTPPPIKGIPFIPPSLTTSTSLTLNSLTTQLLAFALIRSIDPETQTLHLLTPLPEQQMLELKDKAVVLVRGAFDSPDWAYLEDLFLAAPVRGDGERPWVEVGDKERVGVEGAVWRLRHPPVVGAGGVVGRR